MQTYFCKATIGDIAIYCMGAVVATYDDLECVFEIGDDGELNAVKLPKDIITGKTPEVAPALGYPKFPDVNAEAIWQAAQKKFAAKRQQYLDEAGVPPEPVEEPEWTDRRYRTPSYMGI